MALKDLSAFLVPDLQIPHGGKVYTIPPPDYTTGLALTAITAVGTAAFGGAKALEGVPEAQRELVKTVEDKPLGELSLGPVFQQMIDDGLPGPHIDTYAIYAAYYWTLGERVADEVIAARTGGGAPKAQDRPHSQSGQSTGSGSRKSGSKASRSTPTTGSRKAPRGASFQKDSASGGQTSSSTGAS